MTGELPRVFVGVGSNLDDPVAQVLNAFVALELFPGIEVRAVSGLYSNPPMGPQDQPDYVNAVAEIRTALSPQYVLQALLKIEKDAGRDRSKAERWGPRVLDLDLLIYGDMRVQDDNLTVPHAGISERNFVLLPLQQIAPDLEIVGAGRVDELAARMNPDELHLIR